jgi:hypothetical protein
VNKKRLKVECWECKAIVLITRKKLAQVGNYPKCQKHEAEFWAYVGNLYRTQN